LEIQESGFQKLINISLISERCKIVLIQNAMSFDLKLLASIKSAGGTWKIICDVDCDVTFFYISITTRIL